MLLCFYVQLSELFRIAGSQANEINTREDHTIEDAFMVANGVTQDEIEEFHRTSKSRVFFCIDTKAFLKGSLSLTLLQ